MKTLVEYITEGLFGGSKNKKLSQSLDTLKSGDNVYVVAYDRAKVNDDSGTFTKWDESNPYKMFWMAKSVSSPALGMVQHLWDFNSIPDERSMFGTKDGDYLLQVDMRPRAKFFIIVTTNENIYNQFVPYIGTTDFKSCMSIIDKLK